MSFFVCCSCFDVVVFGLFLQLCPKVTLLCFVSLFYSVLTLFLLLRVKLFVLEIIDWLIESGLFSITFESQSLFVVALMSFSMVSFSSCVRKSRLKIRFSSVF